jgi:hypothetical protein
MNARRNVVAVLVILVVIAGGVAFAVNRNSSGGDIFLEGVAETGPDPFTTIAVRQCADGFEVAPGSNECVPATTTSSAPGTTTSTALYGGSGSQKRCDPEALIAYLTSHPAKRKAWLEGLNEDPTLEWSGGHTVTETDLPAFIRELTPTFLTQDTRVTNHSYKNGKAPAHQSVLQKGTAVLVDRNGIPRARCACGNPLGRPHKVRNPHYKGHCWDGCHDRPYCAPPGCSETTTSTSPSTSTTECGQSTPGAAALKQPQTTPSVTRGGLEDPCASTTTSTTTKKSTTSTTRGQQSGTTTTVTTPSSITTTSTTTPTTSSTQPTTSTTRNPNCLPPDPPDCKP